MTRRLSIILFFLCFVYSISLAQNKLNTWPGNGMDTAFDHGKLIRGDVNTYYILSEFLGYKSYWHRSTDESNNINYNRMGLILTVKITEQFGIQAAAAFGKNDDACFIFYSARVDKITEGHSAALSIMNLFSKPGNKVLQAPPASHVSSIHFEGKFLLKKDPVNFWHEKTRKGGYIPDGRMRWGVDRAQLQRAATGIKNKGKPKKKNMGILPVKDNTVIAAMDQHNPPNII